MSESAPVLDRDNNGSSHSSHDTDSDSVNNTPYSFFQKTPNLEGITLLDLLEPASFNIDLKKKRDETYKWVHNYYKEKKKSVNLNMKKLNMSSDELLELKKVLHERIDKAYTRIDQTQKASTTEKIFFSISVYMIFFFGYLIGNHPQYVHVAYSILFLILIPLRIITYLKTGMGYFLADLCYFVNYLLILYI